MLGREITGDIPKIIANEAKLYEANLVPYFRTIFFNATNLENSYHNFRHMLHVTWLCHQACEYYRAELTPLQMRELLIAALFHDFDHPGHPHQGEPDPDRINIEIAIDGLQKHVEPSDRQSLPRIEALIRATHFPYKTSGDELDLTGKIIRDADLAQALNPVWVQQVVIGLAREWRAQPLDVLKMQPFFLTGSALTRHGRKNCFLASSLRQRSLKRRHCSGSWRASETPRSVKTALVETQGLRYVDWSDKTLPW